MNLSPQQLTEIGFDALDEGIASLPAGLMDRVLAAAVGARARPIHPEWSRLSEASLTSHTAFLRTAAELAGLLGSLTPEEWAQPTGVADFSVSGLVVHLTGIERYVLGQLGSRTPLHAPRPQDHVPVARQATPDLVGAGPATVAGTWWQEVVTTIARTAELGPDAPVQFHHLAGDVAGLLVVRTFELWTHGDDIRRACGRPPDPLDDPRLSLMSRELMRMLPFGMALRGTTRPGRCARLNLSGPGGGTYDLPLAPGEAIGTPDVNITVEVIDLCRLAANRLAAGDLDLTVEGDRSLVEPVLVGATAFSFD